MAKTGYTVVTAADVPLVAATAKTILQAISGAAFGLDLQKIRISFNGATYTATPALVEIITTTAAGTPGTGSTSVTPVQIYGRTYAAGFTAASNYSTEPTGVTVIESFLVTPNGGTYIYDFPLGTTPDTTFATTNGIGIRVTAPAAVSARATMLIERS